MAMLKRSNTGPFRKLHALPNIPADSEASRVPTITCHYEGRAGPLASEFAPYCPFLLFFQRVVEKGTGLQPVGQVSQPARHLIQHVGKSGLAPSHAQGSGQNSRHDEAPVAFSIVPMREKTGNYLPLHVMDKGESLKNLQFSDSMGGTGPVKSSAKSGGTGKCEENLTAGISPRVPPLASALSKIKVRL
jgi:hypothetical protein